MTGWAQYGKYENLQYTVALLPENSSQPGTIQSFLDIILTNNNFLYNDMFSQQIMGTAIGTICAPPYASIFMHKIESQILKHAPHSIRFWRRFIDDHFFIFTHGEDKLHEVLTFMNEIHPTIKFTFKYSKTSIEFLDISIHFVQGGKLFSKVYIKPTDTFPLLDFKSNHPVETKLLTTYDEDLTAQGYPHHIINVKFTEATTLSQTELLSTHSHTNKNHPPPLPLVIPYHWENRHIKKILDRNWYLIENDPKLQLIFPTKPFLSYKRNPNIRNLV